MRIHGLPPGLADGRAHREVVRLGAAAREHDVARVGRAELGDGRACVLDDRARRATVAVDARRIAPRACADVAHRVEHLRRAEASSRSSRGRRGAPGPCEAFQTRVDHHGRRALRDREAERGTAEEHALDGRPRGDELHVAAEAARDAPRDREPDAGAAVRARRRAVDLEERIEDAIHRAPSGRPGRCRR